MDVLRWALYHSCPWSEGTCANAAMGGHLEALRWLHSKKVPMTAITCEAAVASGQLEALRWVRRHGCVWKAATRDLAASKLGYTDNLGNLVAGQPQAQFQMT